MRRALVFVGLLLAFLVLTFPHRLLVERLLKDRFTELAVDVAVGEVSPAWPPGYRINDLVVRRGPYALDVTRLRLDLFWGGGLRFDADACGGELHGNLDEAASGGPSRRDGGKNRDDGKRLDIVFSDVDPLECVELEGLEVGGRFGGELRLDGLGLGAPGAALGTLARAGTLEVEGRAGTISGTLSALPAPGGDGVTRTIPIGTWEFTRAALEASIVGTDVVFGGTDAEAEGVAWEVTRARLSPAGEDRVRVNGEFRVRRNDESTRSKAIVGLLPKATEGDDGWRRYRVSGTLDAPRLIGLK